MGKERFICIYRTPNLSEIAIIKSLLDGNKIPYFIENEHFASVGGPTDGVISMGVMVRADFVEDSKEFLEEIIHPKPRKESESIAKEFEAKHIKKHKSLYIILDICGLIVACSFLCLAFFIGNNILVAKEFEDKAVAIVVSIVMVLTSFGITYNCIRHYIKISKINK